MVTVVDPAGTPIPVYNRSGVTIVEITLTGLPTRDQIPAASGTTIVLVSPPSPDATGAVELPTNADIGDVVEVYRTGGTNQIFVATPGTDNFVPPIPSGGGFPSLPSLSATAPSGGMIFRRVSTDWAIIASNV